MATLRVTNLRGRTANVAPDLPDGANITGVCTATSFSGDGSSLTGIDATTIKDSGGTTRVQGNTSGIEVTGVSTFSDSANFSSGVTVTGSIKADSATIGGDLDVGGAFTTITTTGLTEGNNLYYTTARADSDAKAALFAIDAGGDGSFSYDSASGKFTYTGPSASEVRNHFAGGHGIDLVDGNISVDSSEVRGLFSAGGDLSYNSGTGVISFTERTDAEVNTLADARIAAADTDDLSEGSNQYFTTARARQSISATQNITYNSSTGVITGPSLATVAGTGAYSDLSGTPSLATVATSGAYSDLSGLPSLFSGNYNDLSNKPTLGTAAATASSDYATAAQGVKADSALQAETIDLATLKTTVANSASFAAFKIAIAAL